MEKIHNKPVSTGIQKTRKGGYVFRCCLGSPITAPWRKQKTVKGKTDKEARQLYVQWLEAQEQAYKAVHEPVVEAKALNKVSASPTFRDYTAQGDIPAHDGQFFTQLKQEALLSGSAVSQKHVGSLQGVQLGRRPNLKIIDRDYPAFSLKPLDTITPDDVESLLDNIKLKRNVSNNTLNHYLHDISKVFRLAQEAKFVPKRFNPCHSVSGRQREYREKTVITASQYDGVVEVLDNLSPMYRAGMLISLMCGLRREEILGLMWTDIDFKHSMLNVRHTLIQYTGEDGKLVRTIKEGTKNGGQRVVGLPDKVKEALLDYRATLPKRLALWRDRVTDARYPMLWMKPNSKELYELNIFTHKWIQMRPNLMKRGILTKKSRFHDLRAGFISYMLNKQRFSPVIVAKLAGHRSAQMTLDVYGDADSSDINNALVAMNKAFES
jgi:integrase